MNTAPATYDKNNPFPACLVERRRLSSPKSQKETFHLTIDIKGSGLRYKCGDSLGVYPANNLQTVADLLAALCLSGDEQVLLPRGEASVALRDALATQLSLKGPGKKFLQIALEKAAADEDRRGLRMILDNPDAEAQKTWLESRDFLDVLRAFPSVRLTAQEFVDQLRKQLPRLYSIASAPVLHPEAIQLTIVAVRYQIDGRAKEGVCSTFLTERAALRQPVVPVFLTPSHFGPPEDDTLPMIMVGPGTGVAPFRGFMQDRATRGISGKNWLFFGDQHRESDFLYAEEWERYLADGVLTKLSTAFSRDQAGKIYVQDRMREAGAELWQWLEAGAYFYVCGDAKRMAKDVDAALHEVIATHGKLSPEAAAEYVRQLKKDKRYQRDVY